MPYIPPEVVERAREMDLLTYLKSYEPQELVVSPPTYTLVPNKPKEKVLLLPKVNRCATHAVEYLHGRGIDHELIDFFISTGRLYESYPYHNVVFVGQGQNGKPRYANLQGIAQPLHCSKEGGKAECR